MKRGILIALEGIDGSGITTHSKLLAEKLNKAGLKAVYTKEPTEGPIGQIIRMFLKENKRPDPKVLALLFAADRLWHYFNDPALPGVGIEGALKKGYIVISDRYLFSNIAYQGKDVGFDWIRCLNKWVPDPDILIYLNVDVNVAIKRIRLRGSLEYYEKIEELKKVQKAFESIIHNIKNRVKVIIVNEIMEGKELSIEETNNIIYNKVREILTSIV